MGKIHIIAKVDNEGKVEVKEIFTNKAVAERFLETACHDGKYTLTSKDTNDKKYEKMLKHNDYHALEMVMETKWKKKKEGDVVLYNEGQPYLIWQEIRKYNEMVNPFAPTPHVTLHSESEFSEEDNVFTFRIHFDVVISDDTSKHDEIEKTWITKMKTLSEEVRDLYCKESKTVEQINTWLQEQHKSFTKEVQVSVK